VSPEARGGRESRKMVKKHEQEGRSNQHWDEKKPAPQGKTQVRQKGHEHKFIWKT